MSYLQGAFAPQPTMSETTPTPDRDTKPAGGAGWLQRLYRVPVLGALVYLLFPPKVSNPSVGRRVLSWSSGLAAVIGLGMVAYPYAGHRYPFFLRVPVEKAIEWSNFLSDMQTNKIQRDLDTRWAQAMASQKTLLGEGDPLTRIQIPRIKLDMLVVEGTSESALKAGAGHYPHTPLPGQRGNVSIAGHRTTYGRPFNRVDELRVGDVIRLHTPKGVHVYRVERDPWVTHPRDWSVVGPTEEAVLTLTTCHPKGSARQRLIVRARLVKSEPVRQAI
ncbi:MAG TPA: class E sortase [Actinomycetota bacterium]|nr:class E sortase [Actinomycetota bacterium]